MAACGRNEDSSPRPGRVGKVNGDTRVLLRPAASWRLELAVRERGVLRRGGVRVAPPSPCVCMCVLAVRTPPPAACPARGVSAAPSGCCSAAAPQACLGRGSDSGLRSSRIPRPILTTLLAPETFACCPRAWSALPCSHPPAALQAQLLTTSVKEPTLTNAVVARASQGPYDPGLGLTLPFASCTA